ncbi:MAG: ThuA domain-containing protein [Pseudomonadota bacterium]
MKRFIYAAVFFLVACAPASEEPQAPDVQHAELYEDTVAPEITEWMAEPSILVFSKTLGWRHNEGIAGADLFFVELASEQNYGIFTTANAGVFNDEDLSRFDVVIFNNMTGDSLSADQQAAFEAWLTIGGGWIGLHGAGDASQSAWPWYQESLIGPRFIGHPAAPQFQVARVEVLDAEHPITQGIPLEWRHLDEWYSFDSPAQDHGARVLAGLDESTYSPRNDQYGEVSDLRMGEGAINHPIIWVRCPGEGRAFYSAIGHSHLSYRDETYRKLLTQAFLWVDGRIDAPGIGC